MNATTLNGAVNATQTTVLLTSGTGVVVGNFLKVDSEFNLNRVIHFPLSYFEECTQDLSERECLVLKYI